MPEFRRLLEQETPALSRYARRLCRNSLWAEDLLQETLLLALRLENGFTVGTNMRAWLFTLMRNTYRNETRKRRRRGLITVEEQQGEYTIECPNRQETSLALQQTLQAVETLPPAYRETLLLVAVHGLSYAETAQKTGKPVGTVRSRLARARKRIKETLEE